MITYILVLIFLIILLFPTLVKRVEHNLELLLLGFKPLIDMHISKMPAALLHWVNITSAILDNATLAAAELGPRMTAAQVKGIIMGIVISGGMLIPGNIPNIIAANKLKISSRAWAVAGAPLVSL